MITALLIIRIVAWYKGIPTAQLAAQVFTFVRRPFSQVFNIKITVTA